METRETIIYKGVEIETFYDQDYESPDHWGNEEFFLVYDHRDFCVERNGFDPDDIFEAMQENKKLYDGYFYFPVYAYIHGDVSLSLGNRSYPFTCPWDTSFKGFVLVKREKGTWTASKAQSIAEGLINSWNECLSGEVYGYSSESGSCWGFYGEEGYKQMIEEAKGEIDYDIAKKRKEHFNYLKQAIKSKIPYQYRMEAEL